MKNTDITIKKARLYFLPIKTRVPLKFGNETLTSVTCARVCVSVTNQAGQTSDGWGETPLSVQWAWPSTSSYEERHDAMKRFCEMLTEAWTELTEHGHAMELGYTFLQSVLTPLLENFNLKRGSESEPMPYLAALICCSAFDIAIHDAYGRMVDLPVYETDNGQFMNRDLSDYLQPAEDSDISFVGKFPADFLIFPRPEKLPAWHLVGGKDPLDASELTGTEPDDNYPVMLLDWIKTDGLKYLKIKLCGNDFDWDYNRLIKVGEIALENDVVGLTCDFNCTVTEPVYVTDMLDRLKEEHPRIDQMIIYVEQPFPYDLEKYQIDVHSVSARKPLFMDESAHDWTLVRLGLKLGWTGVALKTCKTQTGALLSLCWAKAHGMMLMVQDLSNPMLAQIPHVLLAAHAGTIMGVETNAMQFYPDASSLEAKVHPGLYRRRDGNLDLSTIQGTGFAYRLEEIKRHLPNY